MLVLPLSQMKKWFLRQKQNWKKRRVARSQQSMLKLQIFVGVTIVVVLGLLMTALYYGTRASSMQIDEIVVIGGYTIPHAEVKRVVQQQLQGSYLRLIPRTFVWTYPEGTIEKRLLEIPRLKQSELLVEGQVLTVVFDEYQPQALWCGDEEGDCFFLDSAGFAFAKAPELTGSAFVRYQEKGKAAEVKSQMVDRDFLSATSDFTDRLASELGLYVTHVQVVDELDVTYRVSGGGEIKVAKGMDLDDTFNNLKTILGSEDFAHLDTGSFAYIDLRFGDKVFVNEFGDLPIEETATSSEEAVE